jgi:hypothetical protein
MRQSKVRLRGRHTLQPEALATACTEIRAYDHPTPANDARKPAIATSISRKRTRLLSAAQASAPDDLEADTAMRAWLERAKWGGPVR